MATPRGKGVSMAKNTKEKKGSPRKSRHESTRGNMVHMRLLRTEEKHRSQFLYDQLRAFEDKVYLSYDQFNTDTLYRMFSELAKQTVVDVRKVKSIAKLRQCFRDEKRVIACKLRHRHVKTTQQEERLVKYFTWFFNYLKYLRDLRDNFVNRVYDSLFKYFYNIGYDKQDREGSSDSVMSVPSIHSARSVDSGISGLSGLSSILGQGQDLSGLDDTQAARRKMITQNALLLIGREFQDIKKLYDTSELEKLARRLTNLKERLDYLLDNESVIDGDVLSQDSEKAVFQLKIQNAGISNLMRLIPDVLLKFQKAAWLARRWLERDDEKTKDLNEKLEKINALEVNMNKKLSSLSSEIQTQEAELERQTEFLNNLLQREERSNNLSHASYELQKRKDLLTEQFAKLNEERKELVERLTQAANANDVETYKRYRPLYDRNKLQRFALERQLATLKFHINIVESDMRVELDAKASVIHSTNDVQDRCEELEQTIEKAKKAQKVIQAALIPLVEDKRYTKEQIQIKDGLPLGEHKPAHKAEFVGTRADDRDRVVDLNSDFVGYKRNKDAPVSFFITALPEDRADSVEVGRKPIKGLSSSMTPRRLPEVMASEW